MLHRCLRNGFACIGPGGNSPTHNAPLYNAAIRSGVPRRLFAFATLSLTLTMHAVAQGRGASPPVLVPPSNGGPPVLGKLPKPKPPLTLDDRFAERYKRSVRVVQYSQCMMQTIVAGRTGKVGVVPPNDLAICVQQKGEWRGVFGQFDESKAGFAVRLQYAMRGNGKIIREPIDTAVVAGAARSLVRASSIPFPGNPADEFLPLILQQENFNEIWFLSSKMDPAHAVVGGDSIIQMSASGVKELGHSKNTPLTRHVEAKPGETLIIESSESDVPMVSELVVGNAAADIVPEVRIRTIKYDWIRTKAAPKWRRVVHGS